MKASILIIILSLSLVSFSQKVKVSITTVDELNQLLKDSNKKQKVVYFINPNCSASADFTPLLKEFYPKHKDKFDLYVIALDRLGKKEVLENYLFYEGYYFPVYLISKVGLNKVIKELCNECDEKVMGYSAYFILDETNKFVAQSNFNLSEEEKIEILINYLK